MKKWKLTHAWLEKRGACYEQRAVFREHYPRGLWLYADQHKTEAAIWHADAIRFGYWNDRMSVYWLLERLPGVPEFARYERTHYVPWHLGYVAAWVSLAVGRMK